MSALTASEQAYVDDVAVTLACLRRAGSSRESARHQVATIMRWCTAECGNTERQLELLDYACALADSVWYVNLLCP